MYGYQFNIFSLYLFNFLVFSEKFKNLFVVDICFIIEFFDQFVNRCFTFMIFSFGVKYEMNKRKKNFIFNRYC